AEVGLPGHPLILVDGHVRRLPFVRWAEEGVVRSDETELDRKPDREAALADEREHPPNDLGPVLPRNRVLHLGEADPSLGGEDPVAAVGPLRARELTGGEARDARYGV